MFSRLLDFALVRHKKELLAEIDNKIGASSVQKEIKSSAIAPKFKFEGNGKQHEFNASRLEEIGSFCFQCSVLCSIFVFRFILLAMVLSVF